MQHAENRPKVGVGVIVIRDGKILLGKRKNAHGDGTWCFPGGHLEFGESIFECAAREVLEETSMLLQHTELGPYTNDIFLEEQKHYITLYVRGTALGEPQAMEPDKCEDWQWFSWDNLPSPLFLTLQNLKKTGFRPF